MSDKANVTITSTLDGLVHELHYKVGEMANVGKLLVTFKSGAGGASSAPSLSEETATRQPLPPLLLHLPPNPLTIKSKQHPQFGESREKIILISRPCSPPAPVTSWKFTWKFATIIIENGVHSEWRGVLGNQDFLSRFNFDFIKINIFCC